MPEQTEQLSMWEGRQIAGLQTTIAGKKFAQDQQITREVPWHEEGYAVVRWVCKPDTGIKEAADGSKTVVIREQTLEVTEFYELDDTTGEVLIKEGHEAAKAVIAARYAEEYEPTAQAS